MLQLMAEILHQLRLVVYPIIYRVSYIPGGAGFQPSTVLLWPFVFWIASRFSGTSKGWKEDGFERSFSFWKSECASLVAVLASNLNGRSMSAKDWQSLHRFGPNWKKVRTQWEEWNNMRNLSKPKTMYPP